MRYIFVLGGVIGAWIQVDLLQETQVAGVLTQGRHDKQQWVTAFKVMYGKDESNLKTITDSSGKKMVIVKNNIKLGI